MKPISILREPWSRIFGIPILGFVLAFVFNDQFPQPLDFAIAIGITAIMWQGDYIIITSFRKKWPHLDNTHKRLLTSTGLILLYNTTMDFILCQSMLATGISDESWFDHMGVNLIKNFGATFIIGSLYEAGYFFSKWKEQVIETEQIKSQQLRTELNALRNQVSPHFLFNSLNTLITLIHEDQNTAARFTEKLSEVYRYTLSHKERDVVKLRRELAFTDAYYYLMKIRFEESIHIHVNIDAKYLDKYVAPLTIQMLVENAIKHNIASIHKPLRIDIYVENGKSLIVRNNLQRKSTGVESTGFGLENARRRYAHLSDAGIDVIETRDHFMVALPLLTLDVNKETAQLNV
jgi:hypothetical protein